MQHADFLVEIHTEELPPKSLQRLASSFLTTIQTELTKLNLRFNSACYFVTPRRITVLVKRLDEKQPDTKQQRKGPTLAAAFDKAGQPTPACLGFARSCQVEPNELKIIKSEQGEWLGYEQQVVGKSVHELLPKVVEQGINILPIPKRMRWGSGSVEFSRPVHSVMMLYGSEIIHAEILGCHTGRQTKGHRFLSKSWISISSPAGYVNRLEKAFVIADFTKRKDIICEAVHAVVKKQLGTEAHVLMTEALLDEVTGLVEWPTVVIGKFDKAFLSVPEEALISAMQDHQRYFPIVDSQGHLLPYFVTVSNIENKNMSHVIAGNERVLRARLSDAAFFFETDKKISLAARTELLKHIIFQAKLGSLYDKTMRVSQIAEYLAKQLSLDITNTQRAALLSKTDLTTEMVKEFPELQGTMGYHYAMHDGENPGVAAALNELYMPRFSGDALPKSLLGAVLAIADRVDTIVGVFGIKQAPTGDKDPFGLRRASLGILRILIEKNIHVDLNDLLEFAIQQYQPYFSDGEVKNQVLMFVLDRLRPWYQEQGISADVFAAVFALNLADPYDMHLRIHAVSAFKQLAEAEALSIANKRVSNILSKYEEDISSHQIDKNLFEQDVEHQLETMLAAKRSEVALLSAEGKYTEVLKHLASLRDPVDQYFEKVLVMAEDKAHRENRLLVLKELRNLFLQVADIALLQ